MYRWTTKNVNVPWSSIWFFHLTATLPHGFRLLTMNINVYIKKHRYDACEAFNRKPAGNGSQAAVHFIAYSLRALIWSVIAKKFMCV